MKLNFTSLLYFQRTAEMQHLTNAAESLHVAQPALSRMISGIEKELGVALFERKGRRNSFKACKKFSCGTGST